MVVGSLRSRPVSLHPVVYSHAHYGCRKSYPGNAATCAVLAYPNSDRPTSRCCNDRR